MYNPIRSTSPSAVNSGQPAQSRSISEVVKQPGINLIPQRLTSVMDVTITELDIITRSAHHDLTTLLVVINFVFFMLSHLPWLHMDHCTIDSLGQVLLKLKSISLSLRSENQYNSKNTFLDI